MTGVKFDPSNFKALTLGNIFQMELHRFTADIDDIVNESVQELKIENEIRKVEATWRKTDLVLAKYQKNGVDRSYVLRAADEIKTELEDNLLNLQTMSSSRFVGSFAEQVCKHGHIIFHLVYIIGWTRSGSAKVRQGKQQTTNNNNNKIHSFLTTTHYDYSGNRLEETPTYAVSDACAQLGGHVYKYAAHVYKYHIAVQRIFNPPRELLDNSTLTTERTCVMMAGLPKIQATVDPAMSQTKPRARKMYDIRF